MQVQMFVHPVYIKGAAYQPNNVVHKQDMILLDFEVHAL